MTSPPTPIANLEIVGGNRALDFVNTVGAWTDGFERDCFVTAADVVRWAKRLEVVSAAEARVLEKAVAGHPEAGQRLLRDAKKLRLILYDVFAAVAAQKPLPADRFDALAAAAERAQSRRKLVLERGRASWEWTSADDPQTILDRVVFVAAELAINAQDAVIKECPGHKCGWLFIDTSRKGNRKWCTEAACGTRARVKAFRERKAADR